jgi:pyrroloquinoline quinone (PQQ) biosynthesis protein C
VSVETMSVEEKFVQLFSESVDNFIERSPFFNAWKPENVNSEMAEKFLANFNVLVGNFPGLIALGCARADDEDTRAVLAVNLFQECGEGNVERTHHAIYRKYMETAGIDASSAPPETFTNEWRTSLRNYLMQSPNSLCALGALATGEFMAPPGLTKIFNVIKPMYPEADIEYFTTHLSLEVEHVREIAELLARQVERGANMQDAIDGFQFGLKTWDAYFNSLTDYLFTARQ